MYRKFLISAADKGETAEWKSIKKSKNDTSIDWKIVDVERFSFGVDYFNTNNLEGTTNEILRIPKIMLEDSMIVDNAIFTSEEFPDGSEMILGDINEVSEYDRNIQAIPDLQICTGCSLDGTNLEKQSLTNFNLPSAYRIVFTDESGVDKTEEYISEMEDDSPYIDADGNVGKCFVSRGASHVVNTFDSELTFKSQTYADGYNNQQDFFNLDGVKSRFFKFAIKVPEDFNFDINDDGTTEDLIIFRSHLYIVSNFDNGIQLRITEDKKVKIVFDYNTGTPNAIIASSTESDENVFNVGEWQEIIVQLTEDGYYIVYINNEIVLSDYSSKILSATPDAHTYTVLNGFQSVCFLPFGELSGSTVGSPAGIKLADIELYWGEYDPDIHYDYIKQESEEFYPVICEIDISSNSLNSSPLKIYRNTLKEALKTSLYTSEETEDDAWVVPEIESLRILNGIQFVNSETRVYAQFDIIEYKYKQYEDAGTNFILKTDLQRNDILVDGSLVFLRE